MSDKPIVLDQPDQIRAFFYLQVYHKLKMEVNHPAGPKWKGSPMKQAIHILDKAGIAVSKRTKKAVLADYTAYLTAVGVLKGQS